MKIKTKAYYLLIAICLFTSLSRANSSDYLHTDPWKFMQNKFITAPQAQAAKILPVLAKSTIGLGAGTGAGFGAKLLYKKYLKIPHGATRSDYSDLQEWISDNRLFFIAPIAIASSFLTYYAFHNALVNYYQHQQLIDLLNNWTQFKSKVPSNLKIGLEEVYKKYAEDPKSFSQNTDDVIRVIIEQISEQFKDKTYRKFWDAKVLTGNIIFDIANTINSVVRIFRK